MLACATASPLLFSRSMLVYEMTRSEVSGSLILGELIARSECRGSIRCDISCMAASALVARCPKSRFPGFFPDTGRDKPSKWLKFVR